MRSKAYVLILAHAHSDAVTSTPGTKQVVNHVRRSDICYSKQNASVGFYIANSLFCGFLLLTIIALVSGDTYKARLLDEYALHFPIQAYAVYLQVRGQKSQLTANRGPTACSLSSFKGQHDYLINSAAYPSLSHLRH